MTRADLLPRAHALDPYVVVVTDCTTGQEVQRITFDQLALSADFIASLGMSGQRPAVQQELFS